MIENEEVTLVSVNQNMSEISKATKRKFGHVKVHIEDDIAEGLMARRLVGFMIFVDGDAMNALADELGEEAE